jgi:hypothetical protein
MSVNSGTLGKEEAKGQALTTAPGPKNYKLGGQIKVLRDSSKDTAGRKRNEGSLNNSLKRPALLKSKPPTKTKTSSASKAEASKSLKQSYSAQRVHLQTLKSSLVQPDGTATASSTKAGELYNELSDRNKRKNLHYNSVGRQPTHLATASKKQLSRQHSFASANSSSSATPAHKKLNDQKLH